MTLTLILAIDVLITVLVAALSVPTAFKLGRIGLVGWAARAPFYLLRLYIGPAVPFTLDWRSWYLTGPLLGGALRLPLALWSTVPGCPAAEKWLNWLSGVVQGYVLA